MVLGRVSTHRHWGNLQRHERLADANDGRVRKAVHRRRRKCNGGRVSRLLALLIAAGPAFAQQFRAGAATSNITPPLGNPIVGGFVPFPATHVRDELHARCLVLDDGKTKLIFVVCDLLGIDRLVSDEARVILQQDLKIPKENILISATHTHSACSALGKDARIVSDSMDEYQRFVARRIVDGVNASHNLLRPRRSRRINEAPEHVFNHRWHMKPGTIPLNPFGGLDKVKMNPPVGSADLVEPAGPTDPMIPFIALRETNGKPIALFSTYSLHYVGGVGSGHISADYFGMYCDAMERLLKAERQTPAFVAMMANGTSGDINNINFKTPRPKQEAYAQMKFVADDVAKKVHAAMAKLEYRDHVPLAVRYQESLIATRRPDADLLAWAKKKVGEPAKVKGKTDLSVIYAERALRMAEHPKELKMPLQVFRVGDVAIQFFRFFANRAEFKKKRRRNQYGLLHNQTLWIFCRHHELGGYETVGYQSGIGRCSMR